MRESAVDRVIKGCENVMSSVLSRLYSATCTPHLTPKGSKVSVAGGRDMELPMGLQEGLIEWCDRILALLQQEEEDQKNNREW